MLITVSQHNPAGNPRQIEQVVQAIRAGGIVAYPTDTTYAFGCDIQHKDAIEKILALKQQPRQKLLTLLCADLREVGRYAGLTNSAYKLVKRLTPGPYTFVLPATKLVPKLMLTRQATVGVRVPDNAFVQSVLASLGQPLLSTSARVGDGPIYSEPLEIREHLGHVLDVVVDGGIVLPYPSTILDMREDPPVVVREGKGDVSFLQDER